jgi:hypothetical protein
MKCEEASEFVSALFDGETIPRAAAEHVGACETCRSRLKEYAEIGVELRRVASLESPEEVSARTWDKRRRTIVSSYWNKGWESMRIPRLAFALLWVAILVLGSSLAIVKVRAHNQGPVLVLRIKPTTGQSGLCRLSTDDERFGSCNLVLGVKSGQLDDTFRVISRDGNRIELGVRAQFNLVEPGARTASRQDQDIENLPERRYWLEPGKDLEIEVPGFGPMVVAGELMDHMLSMVTGDIVGQNEVDLDPGEFRVVSPVLLRGKKEVLDFDGFNALHIQKGWAVAMYEPGEGCYVMSISPFPGAVKGRIKENRVSFQTNGQPYVFLMAASVARSEDIWVLHDPHYAPSQAVAAKLFITSPGAPDDQRFAGTVNLNYLLGKAPAQN